MHHIRIIWLIHVFCLDLNQEFLSSVRGMNGQGHCLIQVNSAGPAANRAAFTDLPWCRRDAVAIWSGSEKPIRESCRREPDARAWPRAVSACGMPFCAEVAESQNWNAQNSLCAFLLDADAGMRT